MRIGCEQNVLPVYELVMHSLSLAELRDAVRLSSPVRHPNAKGGKPAQSQHVNRSPCHVAVNSLPGGIE